MMVSPRVWTSRTLPSLRKRASDPSLPRKLSRFPLEALVIPGLVLPGFPDIVDPSFGCFVLEPPSTAFVSMGLLSLFRRSLPVRLPSEPLVVVTPLELPPLLPSCFRLFGSFTFVEPALLGLL